MIENENYSHALFSSLVRAPHSVNSLSFEGETYSVGLGPKTFDDGGQASYDLGGTCGILGHNHPLVIKSYLKAATAGDMFASRQETEIFLEDLKTFLIGLGIQVNHFSIGANHCNTFSTGRTPLFANTKSGFSLNYFFPFSLKECSKKEEITLSRSDLLLAKDMLRFLRDGNFYGDKGLVRLREESLKKAFRNTFWVDSIEGLIIKLKDNHPFHNTNVKTNGDELVFPLSFDEAIINEILKIGGC
ncbi:unnamed protein product [Chrysoparadoxa australica]